MDSQIFGSVIDADPAVKDLVRQTRDSLLGRFRKTISRLEARIERPEGSRLSACEVALEVGDGVRIYGRHSDTEPERAVYKAFARAASALRNHLGKRRRLAVGSRFAAAQP